jgi:hypothetical protein
MTAQVFGGGVIIDKVMACDEAPFKFGVRDVYARIDDRQDSGTGAGCDVPGGRGVNMDGPILAKWGEVAGAPERVIWDESGLDIVIGFSEEDV